MEWALHYPTRSHDGCYLPASSQRRPRFAIRSRATFPILFSYLNRGNPRFVRNVADAVPLNTWRPWSSQVMASAPSDLFRALSDGRV